MRALSIDFGEKRIGLALSDPLGLIATPLEVFEYTSREKALARIAATIKRKDAKEVVIGLPLEMNGNRGIKAKEAEEFANSLRKIIDIPVFCWDERLTTAEAQRALLEGDVSRAGRRQRADMVAAALLLQSYLETRRNKESRHK